MNTNPLRFRSLQRLAAVYYLALTAAALYGNDTLLTGQLTLDGSHLVNPPPAGTNAITLQGPAGTSAVAARLLAELETRPAVSSLPGMSAKLKQSREWIESRLGKPIDER
ncbi:MAG: hypothetical protein ACOYMN_19735 [Roseimicrobium sp.]